MTTTEEQLRELQEKMVQLMAQNEALRQQAAASIVQSSAPEPESGPSQGQPPQQPPDSADVLSSPLVERVVYLPKDRRCPTFTGNGEVTIVDWIDEVKASLNTRRLSVSEQAHFLYDHLGGDAREEIKYRPEAVRRDPSRILSILQEQYGCVGSPIALLQSFHSRKQQEGETLREYANALFALMDNVVRHTPGGVPQSNTLLRDQFVEFVNDGNLSRALKETVRNHPNYDLHDIRDAAIRWEREGRPWEGRPRSNSLPSPTSYSMQQRVQGRVETPFKPSPLTIDDRSSQQQTQSRPDVQLAQSPVATEVTELKELMKTQQQQMREQQQQMREQLQQWREFSQTLLARGPPQWTPGPSGSFTCRRCRQPGHYAQDCDNERVTQDPRPNPPARPARRQPPQQPTGN